MSQVRQASQAGLATIAEGDAFPPDSPSGWSSQSSLHSHPPQPEWDLSFREFTADGRLLHPISKWPILASLCQLSRCDSRHPVIASMT